MPTVRMPISWAVLAMTGAAPVPVPPPMPAVMNTILVLVARRALMSSALSRAARSPISGLAPAPKPSVRLWPN